MVYQFLGIWYTTSHAHATSTDVGRGRNPKEVEVNVVHRTYRSAAVFGLLAATPAPAAGRQAEPPPLLPVEQLFASAAAFNAQVSPDGRWVAYLRPFRGKMNVHVRRLGSNTDRVVTRDTTRPIESYRWSADGQRILYLQDSGGDEGYHLFVADLGATAGPPPIRDLTPFSGIETELIAVPPHTPDTVIVTLNKRNPALADAYRLDLRTGALELAAENPGTFLGYVADPENRVRVAYALDTLGQYHFLTRSSEQAAWIDLSTYPVEDKITPLRFHPDGRRVYLLSNYGSDLLRLVLKDLTTGHETIVDEDPAGQVDIDGAVFDEGTGDLVATRYLADTIRWYPKTLDGQRLQASIATQGRSLSDIGSSDRYRAVRIARAESPTDPGATYLYDDRTRTLARLFEARPELARAVLARTQPISYRTRDGLVVHGYLTLPPGLEPRNLPLLLAVHGGPWSRDIWGFDSETQLFANRGYAVLQVNYRGSTGYGKRFARAARKEFAQAMHRDLLDAVQWAIDRGTADSRRVAILGGSYGGYSALVGLTFTPGVFACAVDYAGPSNLVTLIESFPPSWRPFLPRNWYSLVGNPNRPDDRADLERRSPIFRVGSANAPLLIFQGANDPRTTQEQSDKIARALHARGLPVTYLLARNEGHSFGNRETSLAVNRAAEVFLGRCLGGRVQPRVAQEIERTLQVLTVNLDSLATRERPK